MHNSDHVFLQLPFAVDGNSFIPLPVFRRVDYSGNTIQASVNNNDVLIDATDVPSCFNDGLPDGYVATPPSCFNDGLPDGYVATPPSCTFRYTGDKFCYAHRFLCRTCNMSDHDSICGACSTYCHAEHDVYLAKPSDRMYCDCGCPSCEICECKMPESLPTEIYAVDPNLSFNIALSNDGISIFAMHPPKHANLVNFFEGRGFFPRYVCCDMVSTPFPITLNRAYCEIRIISMPIESDIHLAFVTEPPKTAFVSQGCFPALGMKDNKGEAFICHNPILRNNVRGISLPNLNEGDIIGLGFDRARALLYITFRGEVYQQYWDLFKPPMLISPIRFIVSLPFNSNIKLALRKPFFSYNGPFSFARSTVDPVLLFPVPPSSLDAILAKNPAINRNGEVNPYNPVLLGENAPIGNQNQIPQGYAPIDNMQYSTYQPVNKIPKSHEGYNLYSLPSANRADIDNSDIDPYEFNSFNPTDDIQAGLSYIGINEGTLKPPMCDISTSFKVGESDEGGFRNWKDEYETIQSLPTRTRDELLIRSVLASQLNSDFSKVAKEIVRTVVDELHSDIKTIHPVYAGGLAGGLKFIHNEIFIKFATDHRSLYGGDEFAAKACSNEALGLAAYFKLNIPNLFVPLLTTLDYGGHRLQACPFLPIDDTTLVYGSSDAGKTVNFKDEECNLLMQQAGQKLHLKGHLAGSEQTHMIYSGVDIEVHRSHDNKLYVLDTARVFPPEAPTCSIPVFIIPGEAEKPLIVVDVMRDNQSSQLLALMPNPKLAELLQLSGCLIVHTPLQLGELFESDDDIFEFDPDAKLRKINKRASLLFGMRLFGDVLVVAESRARHLVQLLRPEFVQNYEKHLSSDAYSYFGMHDAHTHNSEVFKATSYLTNKITRSFADSINSKKIHITSDTEFVYHLHKAGINVRFLGLLRSQITDEFLRKMLLTNMLARVIKVSLKSKLRRCDIRKDGIDIVLRELNECLGVHLKTELNSLKADVLKLRIQLKFGMYASVFSENELKSDIMASVNKLWLLETLVRELGIRLSPSLFMRLQDYDMSFNKSEPISRDDIIGIEPVSQTNFALTAEIVGLSAPVHGFSLEEQISHLSRLEGILGSRSLPVAIQHSELALSICSINKNNRRALHHAFAALQSLDWHDYDPIPVEIASKILLIFAKVSFARGELYQAYAIALHCFKLLELCFGTPTRDEFAGHPFMMIVIDFLFVILRKLTFDQDAVRIYAEIWMRLWSIFPPPSSIFGSPVANEVLKAVFGDIQPAIALSDAETNTGSSPVANKIFEFLNHPTREKIDFSNRDVLVDIGHSIQQWVNRVRFIGEISGLSASIATDILDSVPLEHPNDLVDSPSSSFDWRETNAQCEPQEGFRSGLLYYWTSESDKSNLLAENVKYISRVNKSSGGIIAVSNDNEVIAALNSRDNLAESLGVSKFDMYALRRKNKLKHPSLSLISSLRGKYVVEVASGRSHILILLKNGTVWSCGENKFGQLGFADNAPRDSFRCISSLEQQFIVGIAAGIETSYGWNKQGNGFIWGSNFAIDIGEDNRPRECLIPTKMPFSDIHKLGAHSGGGFGITFNGDVFGFGGNTYSTTGRLVMPSIKHPIEFPRFVDLCCDQSSSENAILLSENGQLYTMGYGIRNTGACVGKEASMQGRGLQPQHNYPNLVETVSNIEFASIFSNQSVCGAITVNGIAYFWGTEVPDAVEPAPWKDKRLYPSTKVTPSLIAGLQGQRCSTLEFGDNIVYALSGIPCPRLTLPTSNKFPYSILVETSSPLILNQPVNIKANWFFPIPPFEQITLGRFEIDSFHLGCSKFTSLQTVTIKKPLAAGLVEFNKVKFKTPDKYYVCFYSSRLFKDQALLSNPIIVA